MSQARATAATPAYTTKLGKMYCGRAEEVLSGSMLRRMRGDTDLILTSPPFPLNRKKAYGNLQGDEYVEWLCSFAPLFAECICETGSVVIEIGNAWETGSPTMSTLPIEALLAFKRSGGFHLCQEFIWYNSARLPAPAQWVNVERIRVKDAFTRFWWLSLSERPKATNRNVLVEYSESMRRLLSRGTYNSGQRPNEGRVGQRSFLRDNGGAIPSNVFVLSNTQSKGVYQLYCRAHALRPHPTRMPMQIAEFFIRFLTDPQDKVLDPFAGSNTTGAAANGLKRKWISVEAQEEYVQGSLGRFAPNEVASVSAPFALLSDPPTIPTSPS